MICFCIYFQRNPDIKLYALPWAFPGWIKEGGSGPYVNPSRTSDYVVRWIEAADKYYNLTIDYIGVSYHAVNAF